MIWSKFHHVTDLILIILAGKYGTESFNESGVAKRFNNVALRDMLVSQSDT
jgi:hypothetical protein